MPSWPLLRRYVQGSDRHKDRRGMGHAVALTLQVAEGTGADPLLLGQRLAGSAAVVFEHLGEGQCLAGGPRVLLHGSIVVSPRHRLILVRTA